ncbi:unnamed protein product, partial [Allacma fusca]
VFILNDIETSNEAFRREEFSRHQGKLFEVSLKNKSVIFGDGNPEIKRYMMRLIDAVTTVSTDSSIPNVGIVFCRRRDVAERAELFGRRAAQHAQARLDETREQRRDRLRAATASKIQNNRQLFKAAVQNLNTIQINEQCCGPLKMICQFCKAKYFEGEVNTEYKFAVRCKKETIQLEPIIPPLN